MSTEGSAEVLLLPVADENNIVGSIDTERTNDASTEGGAEVLLLPVAAVANADIPVAQGVMWCGKKLQEKYVSACQSYSDQLNRTLAEQRAKAEDRQLILTAMIDQFTADLHLRVIPGQDVATDTAITDALRRARAALDWATNATATTVAFAGRKLMIQLKGTLPDRDVARCDDLDDMDITTELKPNCRPLKC